MLLNAARRVNTLKITIFVTTRRVQACSTRRVGKTYKLFNVISISTNTAELAGELRQEYKQKGHTLPLIDVLIAATSITHNCQLVTRNKKDYFMHGVRLYDF